MMEDTLLLRFSSSNFVIILILTVPNFMLPPCSGNIQLGNHLGGGQNCSSCRNLDLSKLEEWKRVAIIKKTILDRLGINKVPTVPPKVEAPPPEKVHPELYPNDAEVPEVNYEMSDILSYSEAPENFTDEQIIQFRLAEDQTGRQLHVKSADLLIRVKFPKKRRNRVKKSNSRKRDKRRKRRKRLVDLVISTVSATGKPDKVIATVKSQLRKTKWLRLSLPHTVVQNALESSNGTLQVYIECDGCGPGAELVLVHRTRKRRGLNASSSSRRLNKRRPILYLHSKVRATHRQRRSTNSQPCLGADGARCCKNDFIVDFASIGWQHWILFPKRYKTAFCEGTCGSQIYSTSEESNMTVAMTTSSCVPVRWKHLRLVYYTAEGILLQETLPNMVVTRCSCRQT